MRIRLLFLMLIACTVHVRAQSSNGPDRTASASSDSNHDKGSLIVHQDDRLDILLRRFEEVQIKRNGMPGYRIQIYFGSGRTARNDAYEAKANFLTKFSDIQAYVLYQSPFYKVRVGDFRSKREAYDLLLKVQRTFPNAYITPIETINLPSLD